ncbi:acyl-CoA dehydrogenase [Rhizocola hellebori]|uniref:Acyl-CoA dehydrogenase n=1 Tax=Rhizocola hellebori TaxID=1392758 RepID=A0A8J3VGD1_9ACTN|nr:acyl-CoA dehydrogenase family protein [Rhizocola hellebori]GIH06234.1 acyl-CoA dehydrogenase [Rhizocola hellebori]
MNELDLLRDAVRALLTKRPEQAWERLCTEVGVAGLLIPARFGGAGAGMAEACVVLEELGRVLSPAPMLSTVIATQALLATGNEEACARLLPEIAVGACTPTLVWDDFVLPGDLFFVVSGGQLYAAQAVSTPLPTMDHTRPLIEVYVQQRGEVLGPFDADRMRDLACVALAAEQVGTAEQALAITVDYAKTRVQFGRPIGAFQALQHRMADLHVLVQTARSAYLAALDGDPLSAAVAKVTCSETLLKVAAEMIQIHGGIGITWEHDAHRYFKRAHGSAELFGHPRHHVTRLAGHVLG